MKESLIASNAARVADIERGDQVLVGVNAYTETEPSPLDSGSRRHSDRPRIGRARADRRAPGLAPEP